MNIVSKFTVNGINFIVRGALAKDLNDIYELDKKSIWFKLGDFICDDLNDTYPSDYAYCLVDVNINKVVVYLSVGGMKKMMNIKKEICY